MSPWKVILATLVIFCSGLVTGALMTKNVGRHERPRPSVSPQVPHSPGPSGSWPQQQKDFLRRMEKELDLNTNQLERIDKIFKSSQDRTKKIRDRIAPDLKEEVKRLREEMRTELTPEQQKKFDAAIKTKSPKKGDKADDSTEERRRKQKDGARKEATNAVPVKVP